MLAAAPICQNTQDPSAPLISVTLDSALAVNAAPTWNTKTDVGSLRPSSVSVLLLCDCCGVAVQDQASGSVLRATRATAAPPDSTPVVV